MKRSYLLILALVGALGFISTASAAGNEPVDTRFYMNGMVSYGVFNQDNFVPGEKVGVRLSFGKTLTKYLALELFAFNFNDIDVGNNSGNIDSTGFGISTLLFPARDLFPFYALVGFGTGTYDFDAVTPSRSINEQDENFVDFGFGVLVPLTDSGISLRSEYRYRSVGVDAAGGGEYNFHNQIVSLGIQVPFGAPPQPEVAAAPITNAMPQQPVDNDGDGVPRDQDECLGTPAGTNVDASGCPVPMDSDGDGIPNDRDRCPGTPNETKVNRYGCPVEKQEPIVLKGVTFAYDSAALTAQAKERLSSVVNALKSAENIDVLIAGHTDSIGSASYNLDLSIQRAKSVKEYLVEHGIDADRLQTKGYGETRPIAPNTKPDGSDNPEGRAKNRRVELHVIKDADGS